MARGPRHPEALVGVTGEEGRPGSAQSRQGARPPADRQHLALSLGTLLKRAPQDFRKQLRTASLQGQGDSAPQPGSTQWREQSRPTMTRGLGRKIWVTAPGRLLQAATEAVLVKLGEVRAEGHSARHRHPLSRETFTQ